MAVKPILGKMLVTESVQEFEKLLAELETELAPYSVAVGSGISTGSLAP